MHRWRRAGLAGAVALALMIFGTSGNANDKTDVDDFRAETVQGLYDICMLDPNHPLADRAVGFCLGYVAGAAHYHRAISAGPDIEPVVCAEEEISRLELAKVFVLWAEKNPQYAEALPVEGVVRAAAGKWPCEEKQADREGSNAE